MSRNWVRFARCPPGTLEELPGPDDRKPKSAGRLQSKESSFGPCPALDKQRGLGPLNTGFRVENVLSNPGDSHSLSETMHILGMPFAAPWGWGSLTSDADRTGLVEDTYVIPIHDWFLSEGGKTSM